MARRRKNQVFNSFKRKKLLRKEIPVREAGVGFALVLVIGVMTLWLWYQRDNYDPSERDISLAVLKEQSVRDTLYKTPLKRWRDPSLPVAGPQQEDLGPFPPGLLQDGWRTSGRLQRYTKDNLYEKINGQAEQYLSFGFQALHFLTVERADLSFDLFLYDQGSFANSLGVYQEQRGEKPVKEIKQLHYTPTSVGAIGTIGRHFFHVIADRSGEDVTREAQRILSLLARDLPGVEYFPQPFELLRSLGISFAGIGYAPTNVFQYGFAKGFWFGQPQPGEGPRYFLHRAGSAEEAAKLLERIKAEHQEEYELLDSSGTLLFKHEFLKTFFSLHREGEIVYGVENHPSQTQILEFHSRLGGALLEGPEEQ